MTICWSFFMKMTRGLNVYSWLTVYHFIPSIFLIWSWPRFSNRLYFSQFFVPYYIGANNQVVDDFFCSLCCTDIQRVIYTFAYSYQPLLNTDKLIISKWYHSLHKTISDQQTTALIQKPVNKTISLLEWSFFDMSQYYQQIDSKILYYTRR